jgi:Origin of replication binding protein
MASQIISKTDAVRCQHKQGECIMTENHTQSTASPQSENQQGTHAPSLYTLTPSPSPSGRGGLHAPHGGEVSLGLSRAFRNKINISNDARAFGSSYIPSHVTLETFIAHALNGCAWTPGYFQGTNRRTKNFISAQLIPLDFDDNISVAQTLAHPLIQQYAAFIYPSPSSGVVSEKNPHGIHKTRVVFVLDQPIEGAERWRAVAKAVAQHIGMGVDPASWKPAQPYYGSTNRVEPPHINTEARLPLALAAAYCVDNARQDYARELQYNSPSPFTERGQGGEVSPSPFTERGQGGEVSPISIYAVGTRNGASPQGGEVLPPLHEGEGLGVRVKPLSMRERGWGEGKYTTRAIQNITDRYLAIPGGAGLRHSAFIAFAAQLIGLVKGSLASLGDIEAHIRDIGRITERTNREIQDAILWAHENAQPRIPLQKRLPNAMHDPRRGTACLDTACRVPTPADLNSPSPFTERGQGGEVVIGGEVLPPLPEGEGSGVRVNTRYISLAENSAPTLAVISDIGTGKTRAVLELARNSMSMIYLTHRERLAENFANAGEAQNVIVEHYKELNRTDWRRAPRLAICINSLARLAENGEGLPKPDLLVIDEFSQFLEHIHAEKTVFRKGDAKVAGECIKFMLKHSDRVIIMDAHLSAHDLDYIRAIRPDVEVIHNTYQVDRGAMHIYKHREAAITAGYGLIEQNKGPVVFAVASVKQANTLARALTEHLGESESVLLVTAENGAEPKQSAFLSDPNNEISKYRAVIHSPVIGTGYDITTPVHAVVGIMDAHLTAYDARQMIGRCRNAAHMHVYIPQGGGGCETDADLIYNLALSKYEATRRHLNDDGVLVPDIDESDLAFLRTHSFVMQRRNEAMNDRLNIFINISKGYKRYWHENRDEALRKELDRIRQEREDMLKQLTLDVIAVSDEEYQKHLIRGTVSPQIEAGHMRGKIENTIGFTISEEVRDRFWSAQAREGLRRFTDLLDDYEELVRIDVEEAEQKVPLHARQHLAVKRHIREQFLNLLIDDNGEAIKYKRDELEAALEPLIQQYAKELRSLFGWKSWSTQYNITVLRRVLPNGLKLISQQIKLSRKDYYREYYLDMDSLREMLRYAEQRLAHVRKQRLEAREAQLKATIERFTSQSPTLRTDKKILDKLIINALHGDKSRYQE